MAQYGGILLQMLIGKSEAMEDRTMECTRTKQIIIVMTVKQNGQAQMNLSSGGNSVQYAIAHHVIHQGTYFEVKALQPK